MITSRGDQVRLVRLRAPIAAAYVSNCTEFERLSKDDQQRALDPRALAEGEFFMTFAEVTATFTTFEVVHLDAETSRDEPSLKGRLPWQVRPSSTNYEFISIGYSPYFPIVDGAPRKMPFRFVRILSGD